MTDEMPEPVKSLRGGPVWGIGTEDLNATIVEWPARQGSPQHVNDDRDVVMVVLEGAAEVEIDSERIDVLHGEVVVIEKGRLRRITAGPEGVRYLSVHRRRLGIVIKKTSEFRSSSNKACGERELDNG
jgi:quercetin dioxygenase-like cupin family protein